MIENRITQSIITAAIEVHRTLGPGLLESAYKECLNYELKCREMSVRREVAQPVVYKEIKLNHGYRIDLLVENKVVVELKTVEVLTNIHSAQVLTYLKLSGCKVGLLINFHTNLLKDGIKRFINTPL